MNARKLIIDCDPGIDDSLALMLAAASKELDLVGITTAEMYPLLWALKMPSKFFL